MTTPLIDLDTARRTVDTIGAGIERIAGELIEKGAPRRLALEVAADHVVDRLRHDRPRLYARYLRAVEALSDADSAPELTPEELAMPDAHRVTYEYESNRTIRCVGSCSCGGWTSPAAPQDEVKRAFDGHLVAAYPHREQRQCAVGKCGRLLFRSSLGVWFHASTDEFLGHRGLAPEDYQTAVDHYARTGRPWDGGKAQ